MVERTPNLAGPREPNNSPEDHDHRTLAQRLAYLASDLKIFAEQLLEVGDPSGLGHPPKQANSDASSKNGANDRQRFAAYARRIYRMRRQRSAVFGDLDLFGEPAWDILLDLYIASVDHRPISVSSACIGSGSPPTTGLRWLGILEQKGLVVRTHDPQDQRRVLVHLSAKGMAAMDEHCENSLTEVAKLIGPDW